MALRMDVKHWEGWALERSPAPRQRTRVDWACWSQHEGWKWGMSCYGHLGSRCVGQGSLACMRQDDHVKVVNLRGKLGDGKHRRGRGSMRQEEMQEPWAMCRSGHDRR